MSVSVVGDRKVELDEAFAVVLSSTEATVDDGTGVGTITNDDTPHAPVLSAVDDVYAVVGDTIQIDLTAADQNGDALTFSSTDLPAFATLVDHGNGTARITVAPTAADAGNHPNLHVTVSDGSLDDTRTFAILVLTRPNHQPYPVDDRAATRGTSPVTIDVLRNDTDIDDDHLTIVSYDHRGGRVACGATTCTYTPTANLASIDTFTYTVSDGRGGRADATVTVRLFLNHPPTAAADHGSVHGSGSTSIKVLRNDFDADGDGLSITVLDRPDHGTVECGGTCDYIADGTSPTDGFTYRISDGHGGTAQASVDIAIAPNLPPQLLPDAATAHGSGEIGIPVTANDYDPEGDTLSATLEPPVSVGIAVCSGSCSYTPPPIPPGGPGAFPYEATFHYAVDDGHGGSATGGLVTVTIVKDTKPTAKPDAMTALGYEPGFSGAGVVKPLLNDSDGDGDGLSIVDWSDGHDGTVECFPPSQQYPWTCGYTPRAGFYGTDTFTYTIDDGHGTLPDYLDGRAVGTVTVKVVPNDQPTATDDVIVVHGVGTHGLFLTVNDTDPTDGVSVTAHHEPPDFQGIVECQGDCTYTAPPGYAGPFPLVESFTYTIGDGRGGSASAHVTVTVLPNHPPNAHDDRGSARFGDPVAIAVLANDTDPEGDDLVVREGDPVVHVVGDVGTPSSLGVAHCGTTSCSFKAPPGVFGEAAFEYTIDDGNGGHASATVTVAVVQNRAPIATPDSASVSDRNQVVISVSSNDHDPDGDQLRIDDWSDGTLGTVICDAAACTYTPLDGASGTDHFQYRITDDRGGAAVATVTVTVGSNEGPTAHDDSASVLDTRTAWIHVVGNDFDPEHDDLRVISHGNEATHGTVDCTKNPPSGPGAPDGQAETYCSYTLHADYAGPIPGEDSFSYIVTDDKGATHTSPAVVHVTIDRNHTPTANDDEATAHGLVPVSFNPTANDQDVDGDTLTLVSVDSPLVGCNGTSCVYTPAAAPVGDDVITDSFEYKIDDGFGGDHRQTGHITINIVANGAPTAGDDEHVTVKAGRTVQFSVLGNDGDPDSDPLTIVDATPDGPDDLLHGILECPSHNIEIQPDCTFAAAADYLGPVHFHYTIDDNQGHTASAAISIDVIPLNTPVDAEDDDVTSYRPTTVTIGVLVNDDDPDADVFRITGYGASAGAPTGSITTKGGRIWCSTQPVGPEHRAEAPCRYTPPDGPLVLPFVDSFVYTVTDGIGAPDTATVTVTLDNRPPNAVDDNVFVHGDATDDIDILGNDSDADDDPIVALEVDSTGMSGSVTCSLASGHCAYTSPPASAPCTTTADPTDSFHYTITDSRGASASATVNVTIRRNHCPEAQPDLVDLAGGFGPKFINVRSNDSDPDGDFLTVDTTVVIQPGQGSVTCVAEGCTYTRSSGTTGYDTFQYRVLDGHGGSAIGLVTVTLDIPLVATSLDASPNPSVFGQSVDLTASVVSPGGTPTGTVTFREGETTLGTASVVDGVAHLALTTLPVGEHQLDARFDGTGVFSALAATAEPVAQVVLPGQTSTSLTADPEPSMVGGSMTMTATVVPTSPAAGVPSGTVTFLDGTTTLGTGDLVGGVATFSTSALTEGLYGLTARYDGSASFAGSTSSTVFHQVLATPTPTPTLERPDPDADPRADPDADPRADPDADPRADPDTDPRADPDADRRRRPRRRPLEPTPTPTVAPTPTPTVGADPDADRRADADADRRRRPRRRPSSRRRPRPWRRPRPRPSSRRRRRPWRRPRRRPSAPTPTPTVAPTPTPTVEPTPTPTVAPTPTPTLEPTRPRPWRRPRRRARRPRPRPWRRPRRRPSRRPRPRLWRRPRRRPSRRPRPRPWRRPRRRPSRRPRRRPWRRPRPRPWSRPRRRPWRRPRHRHRRRPRPRPRRRHRQRSTPARTPRSRRARVPRCVRPSRGRHRPSSGASLRYRVSTPVEPVSSRRTTAPLPRPSSAPMTASTR